MKHLQILEGRKWLWRDEHYESRVTFEWQLLFDRICAALDEDLLTDAYSSEEIDKELRALGADPDAIAERGLILVKSLIKDYKEATQATGATLGDG